MATSIQVMMGRQNDMTCGSSQLTCMLGVRMHCLRARGATADYQFVALGAAAIDKDGQAYLWGSNRFSQVPLDVFSSVSMSHPSAASNNLMADV